MPVNVRTSASVSAQNVAETSWGNGKFADKSALTTPGTGKPMINQCSMGMMSRMVTKSKR